MTVYASLAQEPTLLFAPVGWTAGYVTGSDGVRYAVIGNVVVLPSLAVGAVLGAGFTRSPPTTAYGGAIGTFLDTPTSANLAAAVSDETGSGALVFANTPTLVTPILGTPTSGTLTNCTGPWGMERLAQVTTTSSQSTVDFSSISSSYTNLIIHWMGRDTQAGSAEVTVRVRLNNDSTAGNYSSSARIGAQNAASFASNAASSTGGVAIGSQPQDSNTAGIISTGVVEIINYAQTTFHKRVLAHHGSESSSTNLFLASFSARWASTAAVIRITFTTDGTAFKDGLIFTLYGLK